MLKKKKINCGNMNVLVLVGSTVVQNEISHIATGKSLVIIKLLESSGIISN